MNLLRPALVEAEAEAGQGRTTGKLGRLVGNLPPEGATLGAIIDTLGASGTGLILLLFGMTSLIPGIAPVFGLAMCAIAFGMVLGRTEPLLPQRLRRWGFDRERLQNGLQRVNRPIAWLERWMRPRATWLLHGSGLRLAGVASLVNSVLIVLPIPFGNTAPAMATLVLSLGMVVGDGLAVGVGLAATVMALALDVGLISLGYAATASLLQRLF